MEQGSKKNCASGWKTPTSSGQLDHCTQRRGSCTVSSLGSWQKRQTTICYRFCTFPMFLFFFFLFFFFFFFFPSFFFLSLNREHLASSIAKTFTAILCPSFRSFRNLETCASRKLIKFRSRKSMGISLYTREIEILLTSF